MTLGDALITGADVDGAAVPGQRGFRERHIRPRPLVNVVYRAAVAVAGAAVVVTGIVLLPLPGPGWLVIFVGLALLATEFERLPGCCASPATTSGGGPRGSRGSPSSCGRASAPAVCC